MSEPRHPWQMAAEDAEEYTAALGQIMSGGWRQIALAQRLGVPAALDMTTEAWVRERIGGYVRLGLDERREAARALTDPDGDFGLTQRETADVLGVNQATVSRDLRGDAGALPAEDPPGEGEDGGDADGSGDGWVDVPDALDDDEPRLPTMGEILGNEPLTIDDTGLHETQAQRKRWEYANTVLDRLLELTTRYGPEALVEFERTERLPTLARTLDRPIAWLERARALASEPRTQIRSVP
jgi:transcriptional regulator with XRE-family HTH domain